MSAFILRLVRCFSYNYIFQLYCIFLFPFYPKIISVTLKANLKEEGKKCEKLFFCTKMYFFVFAFADFISLSCIKLLSRPAAGEKHFEN
jgi:hypothetical protein